jgi:excisionase family DNA binding protein
MEKEKYLNTREVAERLSMTQDYLRELLREGKIKGIKIGKRWKIKESELKKIIEGGRNWVKKRK